MLARLPTPKVSGLPRLNLRKRLSLIDWVLRLVRSDLSQTVNPNGCAETNTIFRAELAAICAALQYCMQLPNPPHDVVT